MSIDTVGAVSSGVTTYPTVIKLDTDTTTILPNMAVTANIITATKNDALKVPTTSIQQNSTDGTSYVQIMKNGIPTQVTVQTGLASDADTEIVSGLSEGDIVVTATINTAPAATSSSTTSPFSALTGGRAGGGAAFRGAGR